MLRRDFLKNAGCFVATASLSGLAACGDDDDNGNKPKNDGGDTDGGVDAGKPEPGRYEFLHGVASGDPQARLGRAVDARASQGRQRGRSDRAARRGVEERQVRQARRAPEIEAGPDSDFTVRILVDGLEPDSVYFYRFVAGADESRSGRTWTAPETDADVPVRFAWVCCQDYGAGFYGAYRRMINEDESADEADRLRFVLHIGDFVYETLGQDFQVAQNEDLEPIDLKSKDGKARVLPKFPVGRQEARERRAVRELGRRLSPPVQAVPARRRLAGRARALAVRQRLGRPRVHRRLLANPGELHERQELRRAVAATARGGESGWFEYVPALLTGAANDGDVDNQAKDFEPVEVKDVHVHGRRRRRASRTTRRRSTRSRSSPPAVRQARRSRAHRQSLVPQRSRGARGRDRGQSVRVPPARRSADRRGQRVRRGARGERRQAREGRGRASATRAWAIPPGTMLGDTQKKWWKDVMRGSQATFKVWGNSVPLVRLKLDVTAAPIFANGDLVLSADGWDGYPSERRELMGFLKSEGIRNVVSLSGDHHAHFAGLVFDDFDGDAPASVMTDFCTAAISSGSQFGESRARSRTSSGPTRDRLCRTSPT